MATNLTKEKAEILLHGVMHDDMMSREVKTRILRLIMHIGVSREDLEYYLSHEKWPEKTSYDPGREYKIKTTPARAKAALRNIIVITIIGFLMTFAVLFITITSENDSKDKTESASIEQSAENVEEGDAL